jgi:N-dimethylarginine dimethylaminohydrolase
MCGGVPGDSATRTHDPKTYNVESEYGQLKKVLIGKADGFRLPTFEKEPLLSERNVAGVYKHVGEPYPDYVIQEANNSLEELIGKLKKWNPDIEIIRSNMESENNHHEGVGNRGYSTRDVMIVVKDTLYLCPTTHQSRASEVEDCFLHVVEKFRETGHDKVVDLRTPEWWDLVTSSSQNLRATDAEQEAFYLKKLREKAALLDMECMGQDEAKASSAGEGEEFARFGDAKYFGDKIPTENNLAITEAVPIFDAANILVGDSKHLVYLISISGNYHGLVYLKEVMKKVDVEVIPVADVYSGTHIDSTITLLNQEKLLYCAARITLDQAHNIFKRCGYTNKENYIPVFLEDMNDVGLWNEEQNFASVYIGMNLLAISADTLVVETSQERLIQKLSDHGFQIITVSYPHMRSMGGGVHCTTLPLLRT